MADGGSIDRISEPKGDGLRALLGGVALPVVTVNPSWIIVRGPWPETIVLPCRLQLMIPSDDDTLVIELTATSRHLSGVVVQIGVEPRQAAVWMAVTAALARGEQPKFTDAVEAAAAALGRKRPSAIVEPNVALMPRQRLLRAGLMVAVAALTVLVCLQLYDRVFVAAPNRAVVAVELIPIQAPGNGRLTFLPQKASLAAGEPVLGMTQRSGKDVSLESPCDCDVVGRSITNGSIVRRGDPTLYLTPTDARPFIVAKVDRSLFFRLNRGAKVRLRYGDGVVVEEDLGRPTLAEDTTATEPPPEAAPGAPIMIDDSVALKLAPGRELPPDLVGAPVEVSFDLFDGSPLARFLGIARPTATGGSHAPI